MILLRKNSLHQIIFVRIFFEQSLEYFISFPVERITLYMQFEIEVYKGGQMKLLSKNIEYSLFWVICLIFVSQIVCDDVQRF